MSRLVTMALATLLGGGLLGASAAQAQQQGQGATATTATSPAKAQATGACRVKEQGGGRSCTGDVPETACAAIAREAKGPYTWTPEECP